MTARHAVCLPTVLLAAAGCSSASSNTPSSRQVPPGTLAIGFPSDLGSREVQLSNGAKLAAQRINGLGGIDGSLKIRLLVRDTKGEPKRAGRLARRLIAEGARVLILPCDLESQRAVVHAARGTTVILLGTCNYDPALVARTPFFWAVGMGANVEAASLADHAHAKGYGRVYVTPPENVEGRRLARYFAVAAGQRSLVLVPSPRRADAIVSVLPVRETLRLVRRHSKPVLATDLVDSRRIVQADGLAFTTFGYPDPGFATDEFYERYRFHYGVRPDGSWAALAYSAILLFERAVNRAESAAPFPVTHELRGLEMESPLGHLAYADKGDRNPHVKVALIQVKDGKLELLTRADPKEVPAP
jgi:branched-chain amino acid transport system substrate-binding protein